MKKHEFDSHIDRKIKIITMEEQIVSFKVAKLAKEKGFK